MNTQARRLVTTLGASAALAFVIEEEERLIALIGRLDEQERYLRQHNVLLDAKAVGWASKHALELLSVYQRILAKAQDAAEAEARRTA